METTSLTKTVHGRLSELLQEPFLSSPAGIAVNQFDWKKLFKAVNVRTYPHTSVFGGKKFLVLVKKLSDQRPSHELALLVCQFYGMMAAGCVEDEVRLFLRQSILRVDSLVKEATIDDPTFWWYRLVLFWFAVCLPGQTIKPGDHTFIPDDFLGSTFWSSVSFESTWRDCMLYLEGNLQITAYAWLKDNFFGGRLCWLSCSTVDALRSLSLKDERVVSDGAIVGARHLYLANHSNLSRIMDPFYQPSDIVVDFVRFQLSEKHVFQLAVHLKPFSFPRLAPSVPDLGEAQEKKFHSLFVKNLCEKEKVIGEDRSVDLKYLQGEGKAQALEFRNKVLKAVQKSLKKCGVQEAGFDHKPIDDALVEFRRVFKQTQSMEGLSCAFLGHYVDAVDMVEKYLPLYNWLYPSKDTVRCFRSCIKDVGWAEKQSKSPVIFSDVLLEKLFGDDDSDACRVIPVIWDVKPKSHCSFLCLRRNGMSLRILHVDGAPEDDRGDTSRGFYSEEGRIYRYHRVRCLQWYSFPENKESLRDYVVGILKAPVDPSDFGLKFDDDADAVIPQQLMNNCVVHNFLHAFRIGYQIDIYEFHKLLDTILVGLDFISCHCQHQVNGESILDVLHTCGKRLLDNDWKFSEVAGVFDRRGTALELLPHFGSPLSKYLMSGERSDTVQKRKWKVGPPSLDPCSIAFDMKLSAAAQWLHDTFLSLSLQVLRFLHQSLLLTVIDHVQTDSVDKLKVLFGQSDFLNCAGAIAGQDRRKKKRDPALLDRLQSFCEESPTLLQFLNLIAHEKILFVNVFFSLAIARAKAVGFQLFHDVGPHASLVSIVKLEGSPMVEVVFCQSLQKPSSSFLADIPLQFFAKMEGSGEYDGQGIFEPLSKQAGDAGLEVMRPETVQPLNESRELFVPDQSSFDTLAWSLDEALLMHQFSQDVINCVVGSPCWPRNDSSDCISAVCMSLDRIIQTIRDKTILWNHADLLEMIDVREEIIVRSSEHYTKARMSAADVFRRFFVMWDIRFGYPIHLRGIFNESSRRLFSESSKFESIRERSVTIQLEFALLMIENLTPTSHIIALRNTAHLIDVEGERAKSEIPENLSDLLDSYQKFTDDERCVADTMFILLGKWDEDYVRRSSRQLRHVGDPYSLVYNYIIQLAEHYGLSDDDFDRGTIYPKLLKIGFTTELIDSYFGHRDETFFRHAGGLSWLLHFIDYLYQDFTHICAPGPVSELAWEKKSAKEIIKEFGSSEKHQSANNNNNNNTDDEDSEDEDENLNKMLYRTRRKDEVPHSDEYWYHGTGSWANACSIIRGINASEQQGNHDFSTRKFPAFYIGNDFEKAFEWGYGKSPRGSQWAVCVFKLQGEDTKTFKHIKGKDWSDLVKLCRKKNKFKGPGKDIAYRGKIGNKEDGSWFPTADDQVAVFEPGEKMMNSKLEGVLFCQQRSLAEYHDDKPEDQPRPRSKPTKPLLTPWVESNI